MKIDLKKFDGAFFLVSANGTKNPHAQVVMGIAGLYKSVQMIFYPNGFTTIPAPTTPCGVALDRLEEFDCWDPAPNCELWSWHHKYDGIDITIQRISSVSRTVGEYLMDRITMEIF